jgi:gamma-glutamylcyclotransferase (GGCT)/AIG2-like uncharacterized protein YtfP
MTKHYLFSYGTLQQPSVQIANFGRLLAGEPDVLSGYKVDQVEITDPLVLAQSGIAFHPILRKSSDMRDSVAGTVFAVTFQDIERADHYEVDDYERVLVTLQSGKQAWVYVERSTG